MPGYDGAGRPEYEADESDYAHCDDCGQRLREGEEVLCTSCVGLSQAEALCAE
jgi:hypothetical protein